MAASFPNLYEYNAQTGMIIPTVDEIKSNIQNGMREIFGSDIDLSDETPAGRFVEALALMFKNCVGANAQNMNQLNISFASGQYLDALAAFYGLSRLPAVGSKIEIVVYSTSPEYVVPTGTILYDRYGTAYRVLNNNDGSVPSITYDGIKTGSTAILAPSPYAGMYSASGWVESVEVGPIIPVITKWYVSDKGADLRLTSDADLESGIIILANNLPGSILGRYKETDFDLRKRIQTTRDFGGASTMAIANAIWGAVPTLRTVRVLENNTASNKTVSGKTILPHSVLVCVGGNIPEDSTGTQMRKDIATAIFASKAAGIAYTDYSDNDINNNGDILTNQNTTWQFVRRNIIDITDPSNGQVNKVTFYEARGIRVGIQLSLRINGYSGTDIVTDVKNVINQYVGGKIDTLTTTELMMVVSSSITGVFITGLTMTVYEGSTPTTINSMTPNAFEVITPDWIEITVE